MVGGRSSSPSSAAPPQEMAAGVTAGIAGCGRTGRPRNCDTEERVAAAVLDALIEEGYEGMSVDRVARRAGVGRATIYRRWPAKADMIVDAIARRAFDHISVPDSGDLRTDLELMLSQVQECLTDEHRIIQAVNVEQLRHPDLGEAFRTRFLAKRRADMRSILERAVERGELSEHEDLELLGSTGPALIWQRLTLFGGRPPADLPRRIADFLLAGRTKAVR